MLIDTLKAQRRLTASGFNEEQAQSLVELPATTEDRIATKDDLEQLRQDLEHQIDELRQDMDRRFEIVDKRFEVLQRDLTIRIYAVGLTIIAVMAALNFFT
jgi:DNA-binding transcriptional MerR regulator